MIRGKVEAAGRRNPEGLKEGSLCAPLIDGNGGNPTGVILIGILMFGTEKETGEAATGVRTPGELKLAERVDGVKLRLGVTDMFGELILE